MSGQITDLSEDELEKMMFESVFQKNIDDGLMKCVGKDKKGERLYQVTKEGMEYVKRMKLRDEDGK